MNRISWPLAAPDAALESLPLFVLAFLQYAIPGAILGVLAVSIAALAQNGIRRRPAN